MTTNIEQIKEEVSKLFANDRSWHWDDHTFRVYDLAMKFCDEEDADREIVALATLLHDADDYKIFWEENSKNLTNAKRIMKNASVSEEKQKAVCDIVSSMWYSKLLKWIRPQTIEWKIVSDADMLDAMGANGVIRSVVYAVSHKWNGVIFDKNIHPNVNITWDEYNLGGVIHSTDNAINHFFEKLLKLKNLMMTEVGKREAKDRHKLMVIFLRQFFKEENVSNWSEFLEEFLVNNNLWID